MSGLKNTFIIKEGVKDVTARTRELVNRKISMAFMEVERALQAGARDKAATAANYAGQEIDQMFRDLAQRILGGNE
jgi:hypothetical protein